MRRRLGTDEPGVAGGGSGNVVHPQRQLVVLGHQHGRQLRARVPPQPGLLDEPVADGSQLLLGHRARDRVQPVLQPGGGLAAQPIDERGQLGALAGGLGDQPVDQGLGVWVQLPVVSAHTAIFAWPTVWDQSEQYEFFSAQSISVANGFFTHRRYSRGSVARMVTETLAWLKPLKPPRRSRFSRCDPARRSRRSRRPAGSSIWPAATSAGQPVGRHRPPLPLGEGLPQVREVGERPHRRLARARPATRRAVEGELALQVVHAGTQHRLAVQRAPHAHRAVPAGLGQRVVREVQVDLGVGQVHVGEDHPAAPGCSSTWAPQPAWAPA